MTRVALFTPAVVAVAACADSSGPSPGYTIVDIGTLGDGVGLARDINERRARHVQ